VPIWRLFQGFFKYLPDLLKAFGSHDQMCPRLLTDLVMGLDNYATCLRSSRTQTAAINVFCELAEL
jgi:hypothetical protein